MYHLQNGYPPRVTSGPLSVMFAGKGDVTITIADDDLVKLMFGQLNPQQVRDRRLPRCRIAGFYRILSRVNFIG